MAAHPLGAKFHQIAHQIDTFQFLSASSDPPPGDKDVVESCHVPRVH